MHVLLSEENKLFDKNVNVTIAMCVATPLKAWEEKITI